MRISSTMAKGGPFRHQSIKLSISLFFPCAHTETVPFGSFFIQPVRPSSIALFRPSERKRTPCTWPLIVRFACIIRADRA